MAFFNELALRDAIAVLVAIPAFIGLGLIYRQFTLNAMALRHQLFLALTDSLSEITETTMLLHQQDQFDHRIFEERYKGRPKRIRSYLLMKRKYMYLVFSSAVERGAPVREKVAALQWIKELAETQEFRDVHARQACYYPEFSRRIAATLSSVKLSRWMCDPESSL